MSVVSQKISDKPLKRPALAAVVLILTTVVLQACSGDYPQSALHPSSDSATRLDDLFDQIFWWAVGVFVVVEGVLVYTIIKFRERPDGPRPKEIHGHILMEIGWTLAPALILVAIAIPTVQTIFIIDRPTTDEDALVVEAIGRQWWWEFRYPELGIVTANEAHVPVGRTVDLRLRTADVLHSFWIPRLAGKRDLVPGNENQLWFKPDSVGVFWGQCAEYCGTAHAWMGMRMIVDEPGDFEAWAEANAGGATPDATPQARAGQGVFMANACVSCHAVRGTQAVAQFGPDLTHFGSRLTIASGVLENNAENLRRWLDSTQHVKPGNLMPEVELTPEQIDQLVAYLGSLR